MKAEKKQGRRKSGLFPCFATPAVADEVVEEEEKEVKVGWSSGSSSACLTPSSSSRSTHSASSLPGEEWRAARKRPPRRLLAKIVRWAVLVVPLQQKSRRDQPAPPLLEATGGRAWDDDIPNSDADFSSSSSLSSLSSASSSTVSASSHPPVPHANDAPEGKTASSASPGEGTSGDASVSTGLCLLVLLVLFVLVFWGRLCAIVWTSASLCFTLRRGWSEAAGPRRSPPPRRTGAAEVWEKRRVVLEGLLDRSRRP